MKLLVTDGVERGRRIDRPANYDDLRNRLQQRRSSLSPTWLSKTYHEDFLDAIELAVDEAQVMTDIFSVMKGTKSQPSRTNHACRNWVPLVSGNLVIPQPDFFDGAQPSTSNAELRKILDGVIVPSTAADCPFLPNFLAELKAPAASAEVLRRQVIYDGAFGARAMHHLKSYATQETFDENAYTLTSAYIHGQLEIFAHYLTAPESPGQPPYYHIASLKKYLLDDVDDIAAFLSGIAAFRNARDIAQQNRDAFIADATQRIKWSSTEARERYINEAAQRIQELIERNGTFLAANSTSQENPPKDMEELEEEEEAGADIERDVANVSSPPQVRRSPREKQTPNQIQTEPQQRRK